MSVAAARAIAAANPRLEDGVEIPPRRSRQPTKMGPGVQGDPAAPRQAGAPGRVDVRRPGSAGEPGVTADRRLRTRAALAVALIVSASCAIYLPHVDVGGLDSSLSHERKKRIRRRRIPETSRTAGVPVPSMENPDEIATPRGPRRAVPGDRENKAPLVPPALAAMDDLQDRSAAAKTHEHANRHAWCPIAAPETGYDGLDRAARQRRPAGDTDGAAMAPGADEDDGMRRGYATCQSSCAGGAL